MNSGKRILIIGLGYAIDNYFSNHIKILDKFNQVDILKLDQSKYARFFNRRSKILVLIELFLFMYILIKYKPELIITAGPKIGFLSSISSFILRVEHLHWYTGQVWANSSKISFSYCADFVISRLSTYLCCDGKSQSIFLAEKLKIDNKKIFVPINGSINGINEKFFKAHNNIQKEELIVSFLGRITHEKGVFTILDVAKKALEKKLNIKFLICGPMDEYFEQSNLFINECKKLNNIELRIGFVDPIEIFMVSSILILPSLREGFGSVLIEAQASGLPVIVSDIYGVKDSLLENKTGFFCKPFDVKCFFEKIQFFLQNNEKLTEFSKNAFEFSLKFKEDIFIEDLKIVYRNSNIKV